MYDTNINSKEKLSSLSVFFPCYNEEENIGRLLDLSIKIFPKYTDDLEIIVINDGSTDKTSEIAHKYAKRYSFIRVVDQENSGGYGGAIKRGFSEVTKDWVFFTDADLQFDLTEFEKFAKVALSTDDDLIIGYRIKRAEGYKRLILAMGMKFLAWITVGFPLTIKDTDCAFKLIKRKVLVRVGKLESTSNLITTEFLLKAKKKGFSFYQIGVNHYCRLYGESKCSDSKAILDVLRDLIKLNYIVYIRPFIENLHPKKLEMEKVQKTIEA